MKDIALGVQIVRVLQADGVGGSRISQLWLAAVPRDEAVAAVKKVIPADWDAELTDRHLSTDEIARKGVRAGEVRELSS